MDRRSAFFFACFCFFLTFSFQSEIRAAGSFAIPKAPANLLATANSPTQITLTWQDGSLDETGFELERSSDSKTYVKLIDLPANTLTYANLGLEASTSYWYRIRAKNASGFSAYSNVAGATTREPVITIPKAPSNLTATAASGTQIDLAWVDNATDETGFELERSLDGVSFIKISELAADAESFQNTGLMPAKKYWYRILVKNTAGKSAYSNIVSATTLQVLPAAPDDLAGTSVSATQINLTWTDNANNETGFQLERSPDGTAFSKIADLGANVTVYQNTGLTAFTQYYYRVRAVNAVGASPYSNVAAVKTQNIPVPDRPLDLTAVPTEPEVIQLRWSPVTGNATETIIERSKDNDDGFAQIGKVAANVTQFEDRGKLETADYYYRIKATNAGGSSPYSALSIVRASTIITGVEPVSEKDLIFVAGKTLVAELKNPTRATLSVYDAKGTRYRKMSVTHSSRTDLSALSVGIYVVVIETPQKVISRKILLY